jgi:hypothetical protein
MCNRHPEKILIIGNGIIGSHIYAMLRGKYKILRYDLNPDKSDIATADFDKCLKGFDMIIGCTGTTSLPAPKYKLLKKGCVLLSISSSDREFDAVHMRRKSPQTTNCYENIQADDVTLLNCGFPVNFDGNENEDPKTIQLTRALIIVSILQGLKKQPNNGFVDLCQHMQQLLANEFQRVHSVPEQKPVCKKSRFINPILSILSSKCANRIQSENSKMTVRI